jgi:hypothetical protein
MTKSKIEISDTWTVCTECPGCGRKYGRFFGHLDTSLPEMYTQVGSIVNEWRPGILAGSVEEDDEKIVMVFRKPKQ